MTEQTPAPDAEAGNRAKVFISYSRKDLSFAQMLVEALAARGFDAFLDKTDIAPGEPWKERLGGLIAAADTVVFAISPDSVASSVCSWELEESARLGKRLIPVVARRIADADAPPALGRLTGCFAPRATTKTRRWQPSTRRCTPTLPGCASIRGSASLRGGGTTEAQQGRDLARRRRRSRGALARPPAAGCQRADRSASGFHPGEPARGDGEAAGMGRRLARRCHSRYWPRGFRRDQPARGSSATHRGAGAARPCRAHARLSRPRRRIVSSSTLPKSSGTSSACQPRRSRISSTGRASCRTNSSARAKRARICAAARRLL